MRTERFKGRDGGREDGERCHVPTLSWRYLSVCEVSRNSMVPASSGSSVSASSDPKPCSSWATSFTVTAKLSMAWSHTDTRAHTHTHRHTYIHAHTHMHTETYAHTRTYAHTHKHTRTHKHNRERSEIHTHTHTCTCTHTKLLFLCFPDCCRLFTTLAQEGLL